MAALVYLDEVKEQLAILNDRRMAQSLQTAEETDAQLLDIVEQEEQVL